MINPNISKFKLGHSPTLTVGLHLAGHGSDLFPILLEVMNCIPTNGVKRWQLEHSDWIFFRSTAVMLGSVISSIFKMLITSHHEFAASIPRSTGLYHRPPVLLYFDEYQAIWVRKAVPLIHYQRTQAKASRVLEEAKQSLWKRCVSSVNSRTLFAWLRSLNLQTRLFTPGWIGRTFNVV